MRVSLLSVISDKGHVLIALEIVSHYSRLTKALKKDIGDTPFVADFTTLTLPSLNEDGHPDAH